MENIYGREKDSVRVSPQAGGALGPHQQRCWVKELLISRFSCLFHPSGCWFKFPTSMGPMDLSRFFSCISVVEEERPSMVTVQHSLPVTLWFCLVDGGRPRPICTPPRPLPQPDTTTYNQGGCERETVNVYIFILYSICIILDRRCITSRQRKSCFQPMEIYDSRERGRVSVRVLGVGEPSAASFSLSASVSMVSVTAARQWQACTEARGPSVASMLHHLQLVNAPAPGTLSHLITMTTERLSPAAGQLYRLFSFYFTIISISGQLVSSAQSSNLCCTLFCCWWPIAPRLACRALPAACCCCPVTVTFLWMPWFIGAIDLLPGCCSDPSLAAGLFTPWKWRQNKKCKTVNKDLIQTRIFMENRKVCKAPTWRENGKCGSKWARLISGICGE